MKISIRYRLLWPLLLLGLILLGIAWWTINRIVSRAEDQAKTQINAVIQSLQEAKFPLKQPVLEQMRLLSNAHFVLITPGSERLTTFDQELIPTNPPATDTADFSTQDWNGTTYLTKKISLKEPNPNAGSTVTIYYPRESIDQLIEEQMRPLLLAFGVIVVVLLGLLALGTRLVNRIRAIERNTTTIAAGDYSPMQVPKQNDELRDLSLAVNTMSQQLAQYREQIQKNERQQLTQQLSAGLAHQLRNNVTGAKLALQVFRDDSQGQDLEGIDVALRQIAIMETNLRRFLDLERRTPGTIASLDLATLLRDLVALQRPRAQHAKIDLEFITLPEATVLGDRDLLHDLFSNLLDNALDAVGTNGRVCLELTDLGAQWQITISDTGPGPPAHLVDRLFDPFITGKPEGIGLGLAVVKHAVTFHQGEITWSRQQQLTQFCVSLPKVASSLGATA